MITSSVNIQWSGRLRNLRSWSAASKSENKFYLFYFNLFLLKTWRQECYIFPFMTGYFRTTDPRHWKWGFGGQTKTQICRFADSQNSGEKRTTHQILIFMLTFVIAPFIRRQAYFLYFWLDFSTVKPTEPPAKTEDAKPEPEPKSEDKVEEMEQWEVNAVKFPKNISCIHNVTLGAVFYCNVL